MTGYDFRLVRNLVDHVVTCKPGFDSALMSIDEDNKNTHRILTCLIVFCKYSPSGISLPDFHHPWEVAEFCDAIDKVADECRADYYKNNKKEE